ncbi:MAG: E3 binding domain-containing protein, partial [Candidatus Binatia bacterium]
MAIEVIMPKYGRMDEATITRVLKSAGDRVAVGEPLCEIETEKVNAEIEAPQAGVLAAFLHGEQSVVPCGNVVAIIAIDGEDPRAVAARYRAGAAGHAAVAPAAPARPDAPPAMPAGSAAGERRAVSPLAKRRAAELGVDLARVVGSGPGGRVTREDVERAAPSSP